VDLENTLLTWLPIVFFGIVILLLLYTLKFMPRAKPAPVVRGSQVEVSWADVAGLDEAKAELEEVVEFLRDRKRFERLGARVPRGILLHGPPGTGKTLLAKAVASASGANFYSQSASSFVEMFAGLGAARIRKLFEEARKHAPAIIFIDELDAVGTARMAAVSIASTIRPEPAPRRARRLQQPRRGRRHVASNRLQDLDSALLRPGRFDRQSSCRPPTSQGARRSSACIRATSLSPQTWTWPRSRDNCRPHGSGPREPLQRSRDLRRPLERAVHPSGDFDAAMDRIVAGLQQRRVVSRRRSGSSPTTKVVTRSWRISWASSSQLRRRRLSRAARRSATR
jgi:cell division protease FtsH